MKVAVIGTGYVGLVTASVLAHLGHQVVGLDIDAKKIAALKKGKITIFEPGLKDLIKKNRARLRFTTSYHEALRQAQVVFICVGTPAQKDGSYDPRYVFAAAKAIAQNLDHYAVIVIKSTVPPSTTQAVAKILDANAGVKLDVAANPEFLKEGSAVADALKPDRIVIGAESKKARDILIRLHRKLKAPVVATSPQSA